MFSEKVKRTKSVERKISFKMSVLWPRNFKFVKGFTLSSISDDSLNYGSAVRPEYSGLK